MFSPDFLTVHKKNVTSKLLLQISQKYAPHVLQFQFRLFYFRHKAFRSCQSLIQKIANVPHQFPPDPHKSAHGASAGKNVQRGLAAKVQDLSATFRKKQRVYMESTFSLIIPHLLPPFSLFETLVPDYLAIDFITSLHLTFRPLYKLLTVHLPRTPRSCHQKPGSSSSIRCHISQRFGWFECRR
jgi:hypothetical protein